MQVTNNVISRIIAKQLMQITTVKMKAILASPAITCSGTTVVISVLAVKGRY